MNFTELKFQPRKTLMHTNTQKLNDSIKSRKDLNNILDEKKRKKRRYKSYDREAMLNFK